MGQENALHLGYHYVRDGKAPGPTCTPERLRRQITVLKEEGYEFLTCGEITKRLLENRTLPEKHVTLSFDDGLADQYATAFPILKELEVPATFFYITCALDGELPPVIGFQILIDRLGPKRLETEILPKAFAGTPYLDLLDHSRYDASGRKMGESPELRRIKWMFNHWPSQTFKREKLDELFAAYLGEGSQERFVREYFMSGEQLREMAGEGMEIASHTNTHPALDVTGLGDIEQELAASRRRLRKEVSGAAARSFAWPFGGDFRPAARKLAANWYESAWNFRSALTQMPKGVYDDITDIPRLNEQVFLPA